MKYVILGAGPAGVAAAETLVKADPGGNVVLIGGEAHPPYARMAIPYVLSGKIDPPGTYLRKSETHYQNLGIDYVQGRVTDINPSGHTLTLVGGEQVAFDKLLIATGAVPVSPPVAGMDLDGVHHCWTLKDVAAIASRADKGARVVLMGAGFIGSIILESLVERGVHLTVIEAADRMISNMMDETGGDLLKRWVEAKGVTLKTSTKVTGITQTDEGLNVITDTGDTVPADVVVVSVGVKPNIDFLQGSDISTDVGVLVNDRLQTTHDDIYAAGDVAQGPSFGGGFQVHAIQPTAVEHGRLAALNMTGSDVKYQGSLNMNVLDTLGLISASFGAWQGADDVAVKLDSDQFLYAKLAFDKDRLVGALSLGRTDHIGVLRGLIQSRTKLGPWKEKLKNNPGLIADAYVACSRG